MTLTLLVRVQVSRRSSVHWRDPQAVPCLGGGSGGWFDTRRDMTLPWYHLLRMPHWSSWIQHLKEETTSTKASKNIYPSLQSIWFIIIVEKLNVEKKLKIITIQILWQRQKWRATLQLNQKSNFYSKLYFEVPGEHGGCREKHVVKYAHSLHRRKNLSDSLTSLSPKLVSPSSQCTCSLRHC